MVRRSAAGQGLPIVNGPEDSAISMEKKKVGAYMYFATKNYNHLAISINIPNPGNKNDKMPHVIMAQKTEWMDLHQLHSFPSPFPFATCRCYTSGRELNLGPRSSAS